MINSEYSNKKHTILVRGYNLKSLMSKIYNVGKNYFKRVFFKHKELLCKHTQIILIECIRWGKLMHIKLYRKIIMSMKEYRSIFNKPKAFFSSKLTPMLNYHMVVLENIEVTICMSTYIKMTD